MIKVYCGKNRKGMWKASTNEERVEKFQSLFESEVDVIHNNRLFMIRVYRGFDYNFGGGMSDEYRWEYKLYHSVSAARKSKLWLDAKKKAEETPGDYHVTDFMIASDDYGEPFEYGDVMLGKFNMQIIPIKVIE